MKDFHAVLGVEPGVSADDLKKQYRKLAMQHHPDRGGDEEKFKDINEAYTALSLVSYKSTDDVFNDFFWASMRQASKPRRIRYDPSMEGRAQIHVVVSVDDVRAGRVFDYTVFRSTSCTVCPTYSINAACNNCQGYGFTNSQHVLKLKVEEMK